MDASRPQGEIRILPEILSNQIAAGEVVQRPVSVVKELVENSIDAGAQRIIVEIEKGGKSLIRISDDGVGLSRDQALLSIERYATSKIFSKDDLFNIGTFGFRGEALPSIASVSKFTLVSRTRESDVGVKLVIHGGKLSQVEDAGAPSGTMVEVKSLFYNTPARRKFLKADSTEAGHIADAVAGMALGNPSIGFRLVFNGKVTRNFPPGQDLFQRALAVLGKDATNNLYSLDQVEGPAHITGVCANPALTRSTANRIYLFVNHRLVHDRGVVAAMFKGYRGRIMKGRYPMGVICVQLPYDQVDVNVHPTKREVKFINPRPVYLAVTRAIESAMASAQTDPLAYASAGPVTMTGHSPQPEAPLPSFASDLLAPPRKKKKKQVQPEIQWAMGDAPLEKAFTREREIPSQPDRPSEPSRSLAGSTAEHAPEYGVPPRVDVPPPPHQRDVVPQELEPPDTAEVAPSPLPPVAEAVEPVAAPSSGRELPVIIGQTMGTYILAELDKRLLLIDQHAAHERIVYETLKARHSGMAVQSQSLLVPETLELSHREADLLSSILEELEGLGLRVEPFGGTTYVIKAVPVILAERSAEELVMNIIETLLDTSDSGVKDAWLEDCLISMACHTAIRANKPMHPLEMERLVKDLFVCDNPFHCPHGRPTIISFDTYDLEKLFKRVV
ncbi:MAG: DNA mismatch repair endonuclease MutL [Desulfobacterales bacterium]|nr:DNA mismatch repair endonuclease MutL [Desulfobacterales bacterium]